MRFENDDDISRENKAIETFVRRFGGSYKKLDPNDVDFRIYDKNGIHVGYAEVKGRLRSIDQAYLLPIAVRKLVKLADKRFNAVVIWACDDGIIYANAKELQGDIKWGGRTPRDGAVNDQEFMAYFDKSVEFKTIRY